MYSDYILTLVKTHPKALDELCSTLTTTEDGSKKPLNTTYLKRGSLSQFHHLPFLPVDDPDDSGWDFLSELGVSIQVNGRLYLIELTHLSEQPLATVGGASARILEQVKELYNQLYAHSGEGDLAKDIR